MTGLTATPLIIIVWAYLLFGETPTVRQAVGVLVSLAGVAAIAGHGSLDVLAHPAIEEPFGLALVEAMAAETPIAPEEISHQVIVPIASLKQVALQTLAYARAIARGPSDVVTAVHITDDPDAAEHLRLQWEEWQCGVTLTIVESPYRSLVGPLLAYIDAVHAHAPETVYVVPIKSDSDHYPPDGKLRVYRSRSGGNEWEPLTNGLPQSHGYVNVLRDAMAVDRPPSCGVYFGTTGGQVYGSADEGDSWAPIVRDLPAVLSVEAQTLP